jgi:predicted TIM-barrel fold metal-dependent hydrolase
MGAGDSKALDFKDIHVKAAEDAARHINPKVRPKSSVLEAELREFAVEAVENGICRNEANYAAFQRELEIRANILVQVRQQEQHEAKLAEVLHTQKQRETEVISYVRATNENVETTRRRAEDERLHQKKLRKIQKKYSARKQKGDSVTKAALDKVRKLLAEELKGK